jgi:hypothetical protein
MKHFKNVKQDDLLEWILLDVEYIGKIPPDKPPYYGHPCILRKDYRKLYSDILPGDVEQAFRRALREGLITATVTKKGFEDIRLNEEKYEEFLRKRSESEI